MNTYEFVVQVKDEGGTFRSQGGVRTVDASSHDNAKMSAIVALDKETQEKVLAGNARILMRMFSATC